ncbi:YwdI family protein [Virgibacillus necropolis]|uniref:YwdI family protein n=1 Tax=Virgibacillus necropolis TaxID=163877 RepID=A0A221M8Q8_9BACI|nr:YwdI family protein [Virgibacillus necropolis]ASN04012.1 hypothetical protein CFK40_02855 [Virgibacillus necropolis]
MAIPNETILKKMMHELQQAQLSQSNHSQMVRHIENVRLLSDLIVDDGHVEQQERSRSPKAISDDEMKAMFGSGTSSKKTNEKHESEAERDDANGKSIFDF